MADSLEYRDSLLAEMRLGDRAEAVKPYLLPWLESSRKALFDRLCQPATPDELRLMNAMAILLSGLQIQLENDIDSGRFARGEFRHAEGLD